MSKLSIGVTADIIEQKCGKICSIKEDLLIFRKEPAHGFLSAEGC